MDEPAAPTAQQVTYRALRDHMTPDAFRSENTSAAVDAVLAALREAGYTVARLERAASLSRMCSSCDRAAMDGVPPDPCPTGACRPPLELFRVLDDQEARGPTMHARDEIERLRAERGAYARLAYAWADTDLRRAQFAGCSGDPLPAAVVSPTPEPEARGE